MARPFRLSKSKILAGYHCQKRLWLKTHRCEQAQVSPVSEHIFRMGHLFRGKARVVLGPGQLMGHARDVGQALRETPAALRRAFVENTSVSEAAFKYQDVVSRADAFAPHTGGWHRTEVKASTSEAILLLRLRGAGVGRRGSRQPSAQGDAGLVNNELEYPGGDDFAGMIQAMTVKEFARRLIETVGKFETIIVYSSFEQGRLEDLCRLVLEYCSELRDIGSRVLDLLPIVHRGYFHPAARGSHSLKLIASTRCVDLDYEKLDEVGDSMAAQSAWWDVTSADKTHARRRELIDKMLKYCKYVPLFAGGRFQGDGADATRSLESSSTGIRLNCRQPSSLQEAE
jgi:hypothetical protein